MAVLLPVPGRLARTRLVGRALLDWIAPRACAACDEALLPEEIGLCQICVSLVDDASPLLAPPAPRAAPFVFGGPLADAIRRAKYGRRPELVAPLGELLSAACADLYRGDVDVVVPVPLHARRLAERGFNQAALLAGVFARAIRARHHPCALARVRNTRPQSDLDAQARADNVAGAFAVRRGERAAIRGCRVLVVDDVRTTGSTLDECARACMRNGAEAVWCLALAAA